MDHSVKHGGCMQRCTSICLRAMGLEPPILLGRYWRFLREWGPPFRHKSLVMDGAFYVFASFFHDARDALERHGIRLTYCQGMAAETAWEWALERLQRGQPVATLLDSFYLPVYPTFYQKLHLTHVYVLARYDPTADVVYLLNPRQTVEVWPVAREVFMTAWAREEQLWYDIQRPSELAPYTSDDLSDDLRRNLHLMLPDHPGEQWTSGVPALRRFADELATYPDRFEEVSLKAILEDGFHQLPNIREQRWLHGAALRLVGGQLALDPLVEIGQLLDGLGNQWSVARNWFVRAAEMGDLRRGVDRLVQKLRPLADAEEDVLRRLRSLLDSSHWPRGRVVDRSLRELPELT